MSASKVTNAVSFKPVEVPEALQEGDKFIKWDEDSGSGIPVTLRVDKYGFFLYWTDQNKDVDLLDISSVRDVRTGKFAKIPKDSKLRNVVAMGAQDTLEEKTLTLCCGSDFVNLNFINFCCNKKETAQLWTDELLKIAFNLALLNSSAIMFLRKSHVKLTLMLDKAGKIPVKNIIKIFAQNKEDRKRVEKALDASGIPSGKNDTVSVQKFQFEDFFNFYKNLTQRTEVEKIFEELCGNSKRKLMSAAQLVEFLNHTQRDPRLNEILYPYADTERAKDLIAEYETNKYNAQRAQFSCDGFLRYLMSADNPIMSENKLQLTDDMDQPLAHYFINSSHNTYLTGHQLTGKSSVEIYRQCLLAGCRCVELDFWNGRTDEPVIVHGYTFVPEISAKEVIEAIADSAFKTSEYPVILSFENHCNPRQQAKIAQYCRDYFQDMLLEAPLDSHKLEPGVHLPPPSLLKRKIIIKNKKKHHHHHSHHHKKQAENPDNAMNNGDITATLSSTHQDSQDSQQGPVDDEEDDEESSSGDDEEDLSEVASTEKPAAAEKISGSKETQAGAEISALVNYIQPVHFTSFENSEKKNRNYEMSSFDEKQATTLLKERPIEFVNYNKHQLSRVYPAGTRFDSSNFMPQVFWNAGCQLVALNFQTLDLAMQLNLGIFDYNQRCGYLLKPEFMRRRDRRFDPFAESTVDGIIAGTVSVHILSAQFLTDKRVGTYVEVDMYGLPADTVRKKFRTKIIPNNGINPIYDEEPFVFKKVVLPDLASIRIAAYEESGKFIGHRVLPVVGLCPGYRHVSLRNEAGQPLGMPTVLVHIVVKDYVPHGLSDFAEALANPIKFQSQLEKRAKQLAVLTDDLTESTMTSNSSGSPSANRQASGDESSLSKQQRSKLQNSCPDLSLPIVVPTLQRKSIAPSMLISSSEQASVTDEESTNSSTAPMELPAAHLLPNKTSPKFTAQQCSSSSSFSEELVAEPLEKLMEYKPVREKRLELEKKLESLRKKHEKERNRLTGDPEKTKSKFHMGNRLVKRLSNKNIIPLTAEHAQSVVEAHAETSETEVENTRLPRSQSERLLSITKDHVNQERELEEKYHNLIFAALEKSMRSSQASQLKFLGTMLEKETEDVMRKLQSVRRDEVKQLSKVHRDKDEMIRIKREVASAVVEKGVSERVRLSQLYEKRREDLEKQHQLVRLSFEEEKTKAKNALLQEYQSKLSRFEEESSGL
nr:PREDICTED: 1-phosphatidylinositol 4,5-bisphosphate phosphodiesterase classes I and II [Bemisia tabaci]